MTQETPQFLSEAFAGLSLSVGRIIVLWGLVDSLVTACVAELYHGAGGNVVRSELPRNWTDRTKFVRKCLNEIAALSEFRVEGIRLLDDLKRLAKLRDALCHGAIEELPSTEDSLILIQKFDVQNSKQIHERHQIHTTYSDLTKAGVEVLDICVKLQTFARRLQMTFTSKNKIKPPTSAG